MMTKQLSSETVDTVDNGAKTSVENVVENAAKSKVETGTNKHERNRRRSSDFDEEDWQEKGKVIDEVKICSYENNYKEVYFAKQTDTSISTVRRIFSFRTQKTAASWSSIFKLVKCLSNECVNANHLVVLLGTMLLYLVRERAGRYGIRINESIAGLMKMAVSDEMICFTYSAESYAKANKAGFISNEILCFNWKGEKIKKYLLPFPISTFCVDKHFIYGVRYIDDESIIYRFKL